MKRSTSVRSAIFATFLIFATPAHAKDLLDYVIEAVDPTLAPARPLIECLAGGGAATYCAAEAAKKQASGVLPIGPGDDRVQLAVGVFTAAREERWLDVLTIGGQAIAKTVSCAMLPVQGPLKGPACNIVGWVISQNANALDQAWQALTGPDWWALVDLLGTGVCDFIPGEGAAGYAKDALCGPLAAVLIEAKKFAESFANGVVAGADALENLVFGDDSHMPYDRYFALYWQPWYHYSTARIWKGESLGPAVGSVYNRCVDYFDSHNQYRSTARKTCRNLNNKFDAHVKGFANALPVAVDGYFETIAKPAIRGFARNSYGKPAQKPLPGENLFVMNCVFQIRQRFPFPEPDELTCQLLADKAKHVPSGGLVPLGPMYQLMAKSCFSNVQQQTLDPTVWAMACDELRPRYGQVFATESLKLIKIIADLKQAGCAVADPKVAGKLLFDCQSYAAHAECLEALLPNGQKHCAPPTLKLSDSQLAEQSVGAGAQPSAAALGAAAAAAAAQRSGRSQPMAESGRAQSGMAAGAARRLPDTRALEAEQLVSTGAFHLRGGEAVVQPMAGFGPGWSGNAQLFWHGGAVGATLDLLIDVPRDGTWAVEIALTQAPDYGELEFEVDRHPAGQRFDGFAPGVAGPVTVVLGTFAMQQGQRPVSLKIVGRNPAATGWLVGVDRVVLTAAGRQ